MPVEVGIFPSCGASLDDWHAKSYAERLILALGHPLAGVRSRPVILPDPCNRRQRESWSKDDNHLG
jgi:hypothetical protein